MDGKAIGLLTAVAAAFTDPFVDHHFGRRCLDLSAFALTALFGRALLVVDEDGRAGHCGEFPLNRDHLVAVADLDLFGQVLRTDTV